jgi:putative Holliday junction resolvase
MTRKSKKSKKKKVTIILGIDYGLRKIGLSIADTKSKLAEPHKVLKVSSDKDAMRKIDKVLLEEKAGKIVIGISESKMAKDTEMFVKSLIKKIDTPVVLQDETLTTQHAQDLSIKAGVKRKKRKKLEDAYAATLMLQSYLDNL